MPRLLPQRRFQQLNKSLRRLRRRYGPTEFVRRLMALRAAELAR